ncbi:MAG: hypothetical protein AB7E47_05745 [Desulfovibrionaceae bacterium]
MRRNALGLPKLPAGVREQWRVVWPWSCEGQGLWAWWDGAATITYYVRLWIWLLFVAGVLQRYLTAGDVLWSAWAFSAVLLLATLFSVKHERGHALGIPASGCLGERKWCVMAEESLVGCKDGSWRGKAKLLPHQIVLGRGRYCPACAARISRRQVAQVVKK